MSMCFWLAVGLPMKGTSHTYSARAVYVRKKDWGGEQKVFIFNLSTHRINFVPKHTIYKCSPVFSPMLWWLLKLTFLHIFQINATSLNSLTCVKWHVIIFICSSVWKMFFMPHTLVSLPPSTSNYCYVVRKSHFDSCIVTKIMRNSCFCILFTTIYMVCVWCAILNTFDLQWDIPFRMKCVFE